MRDDAVLLPPPVLEATLPDDEDDADDDDDDDDAAELSAPLVVHPADQDSTHAPQQTNVGTWRMGGLLQAKDVPP